MANGPNEKAQRDQLNGRASAMRHGRPRKPAPTTGPCTQPFDNIARLIVAAAKDSPLWLAAKQRARATAECDQSLSPAAVKVFSFLLDHFNRNLGYDWHGIEAIGEGRCLNRRTVQKGLKLLTTAGYTLRTHQIVSGSKASKIWRTTLPALARAADEIRSERRGKDTPGTHERPRPKNGKDTHNKSEGNAPERQDAHAQMGARTLEETIQGDNTHTQPARQRAPNDDPLRILKEITTDHRRQPITELFDPLLRQRRFDAPDPTYTLGRIADQAAQFPPDMLREILQTLLRTRAAVVKPSDLETALREADAKWDALIFAGIQDATDVATMNRIRDEYYDRIRARPALHHAFNTRRHAMSG